MVADPIPPDEGGPATRVAVQNPADAPATSSADSEAPAKEKTNAPSEPGGITKMVAEINKKIRTENREVKFETEKKSGRVIFRLIDSESGEVLRQLPSDDVLRMAEQVAKDSDTHFVKTTA